MTQKLRVVALRDQPVARLVALATERLLDRLLSRAQLLTVISRAKKHPAVVRTLRTVTDEVTGAARIGARDDVPALSPEKLA